MPVPGTAPSRPLAGVVRGGGGEPIASGAVRVRRLGILSGGLVLGALGVATTGCADQTVAAQVGDQTITEAELNDELDALKDSAGPQGASQFRGQLRGSYSQDVVGGVLEQRIILILLEDVLRDQDLEVTQQHLDQARQMFEQDPQTSGSFADLPEDYRDQVVEDQAALTNLQELPPEEAMATFEEVASRIEIDVDSRYGSWDPDRLVDALTRQGPALLPPEGPQRPDSEPGQDSAEPAAE